MGEHSPRKFSMYAREGRANQLLSDGVRQVAGCVVVNPPERKVLLVSSRSHAGDWVLPKGGWENDESVVEAAVRETWEEAGVIGKVHGCIGCFDHHKKDPKTGKPRAQFHFFELHATKLEETWPEDRQRIRKWFMYDEAVITAAKPFMKAAIDGCSLSLNSTVSPMSDVSYATEPPVCSPTVTESKGGRCRIL